jgi:FO synthase
MNESITRAAGTVHGQELRPEDMESLIASVGRIPRQRTTLYETPNLQQTAKSYGHTESVSLRGLPLAV